MIWGILALVFAFFLGPLAKKSVARLGLSGLYALSAMFFIQTLVKLEAPVYYSWAPQTFALFDFSFVADPLGLIFCILITVIGSFIMAYSSCYIDSEEAPRFTTLMNFFTLSMIGLVLSSNLLGLFVFWEFTSICSYFLISFDGSNERARKSAWQSLLVTAFGGLCLLCGLLIIGAIGGSYDIQLLRVSHEHPWLGGALLLVFIGVFTKSAQFPFHFWLPNAMTAPSPASAYLHSATMVKAGIFLLLRLSPSLADHPYWTKYLVPAGIMTALIACALMLFEKDLKRIFAYTTLSALGLIVYMIGKNTPTGYYLAVTWIVTHAIYKAPLFLLAGNIEHYSGSRDITTLSQLYPRMKGSLIVAILAIFSLIGIPPVISSHAKGEFFNLLGNNSPMEFWILVFIFATAGSVAITLLSIFLKSNNEEKVEGRFFNDEDDPAILWLPPLALLITTFMLGLSYKHFSTFIKTKLPLSIPLDFTGIGAATIDSKFSFLSTTAVIFISVFFAAISYRLRHSPISPSTLPNFDKLWTFLFNGLLKTSKKLFNFIQNNRVELYTLVYFAFVVFLLTRIVEIYDLALPLASLKFPQQFTPFEIALIAAMFIASTLTLKTESNLSALVVLGIIGFGIGFLYLVNSAPDLALTQFLVESLTLILLVLTFRFLPKTPYKIESRIVKIGRFNFDFSKVQRGIILFVSVAVGLSTGTMTFLAASSLRPQTLARYFGDNSLTLANGQNVVNVTIVDFRGFDTLGEITVLIIAAIGVASLLGRKMRKGAAGE